MSISVTSNSVIAQPGQQTTLGSLFTLGTGLPATIGLSLMDDQNYTLSNPGFMGSLSGNGNTAPIYYQTPSLKTYDYVLFTYDAASGQYLNSALGSFNNVIYTAPSGLNHVETLTLFSFKNGPSLSISNLTDYRDLAVVTEANYQNPFATANANQATPNEIAAIAQSFVGKVWHNEGCQILGAAIAALAGSTLPFTAVSQISSNLNPILAQGNGEWIVAYDGRLQASPSYQQVEAIARPGDVINVAWRGTGFAPGDDGHLFTVVSGAGANALVVDNSTIGGNRANDGSSSDILIAPPHSLDELLNQFYVPSGGAIPASIQIYRLDTPVMTATQPSLSVFAHHGAALAPLFAATDPAGNAITRYQIYDTNSGDSLVVNGVSQSADGVADAVTVPSLSGVTVSAGAVADGMLEIRAFNGNYWGDWNALPIHSVAPDTVSQALAANAQSPTPVAISDSAAALAGSLDALAPLAASGQILDVTLTDGAPAITLSNAQLANDWKVLSAIKNGFSLSLSDGDAAVDQFLQQQYFQRLGSAPDLAATNAHAGQNSVVGFQSANLAAGYNAVVLAHGRASYHLSVNSAGTVSITDIGATDATFGQTVTVTGANYLVFNKAATNSDGSYQSILYLDHAVAATVAELYVAAFHRLPDLPGLEFWQNVAAQGTSLSTIAGYFIAAPEFQTLYHGVGVTSDKGGPSDTQFITALYQNALNRSPDGGGLTAWVNDLTAGDSRGNVLVQFATSAENVGATNLTNSHQNGWLLNLDNGGYHDGAGSAAVHLVGAAAASPATVIGH